MSPIMISPGMTLSIPSPLTPTNQNLVEMLRYRPSLEFSPDVQLSRSTALVPYQPEAFAKDTRIYSSDKGTRFGHGFSETPSAMKLHLQSLIDIISDANASHQVTPSHETFLRQVREDQEATERVLKAQTAAAAAAFVQGLVAEEAAELMPAVGSDEDVYSNSNPPSCQVANAAQSATMPKDLDQAHDRADARVVFKVQERLQTSHQGEEPHRCNVAKIKEEMQKILQMFARSPAGTAHVYILELVYRHPLASSSVSQPRRIFPSSLVPNSRAMDDFLEDVENELRKVVCSTKTRKLFSIEMMLHPFEVGFAISQGLPDIQVALEHQEDCDHISRRCLADHISRARSTDAGTQTLFDQVRLIDRQPSTSAVTHDIEISEVCRPCLYDHSSEKKITVHLPVSSQNLSMATGYDSPRALPQLLHSDRRPNILQLDPSAVVIEPDDREPSQAAESHDLSELVLEGEPNYIPIKDTVTRIMAPKKERQAQCGPDRFLGLLDLVRKKRDVCSAGGVHKWYDTRKTPTT